MQAEGLSQWLDGQPNFVDNEPLARIIEVIVQGAKDGTILLANSWSEYCDQTIVGNQVAGVMNGKPVTHKYVTIAGEVRSPATFCVPVGTPIEELLDMAGGETTPHPAYLLGGPMMGLALMNDELPLLKQNNAILALAEEDVVEIPASTCIRCGRCVDVCPMQLLPTSITKAYYAGNLEELKRLSTMTCMECGSCSFSCPAHRPILQTIRMAKDILRAAK